MDNKYWENRKAQRMFEYMQDAEETADKIVQAYWKATGYINSQLDVIYDRFRAKHSLSNAEARKLLNKMQDKTSIDELRSLLKQSSGDEKKELLKLIESPAYSARIQRLQSLQQEIDAVILNQYNLEQTRSTRHYTSLAQDSYYKSIYDIQTNTGLAFSFSKINANQIDKLLNSKWSGKNYSNRIWDNTRALAQDLKEELLINILTGRTDREVAEIIANKFGSGAMLARRLVRTESCYIVNEMEGQIYDECGIEYYVFIATLDMVTSKQCRALDQKKFKVKDRQPGENYPPMHPWCRSTTIAFLDEDTLKAMERIAKDPETGEKYKIPGDIPYQQWYDEYVKGVEDDGLNIHKFKDSDKIKNTTNHSYDVVDKYFNFMNIKTDNSKVINYVKKDMSMMPLSDLEFLINNMVSLDVAENNSKYTKRLGFRKIQINYFEGKEQGTFAHEFAHFVSDKNQLYSEESFKDVIANATKNATLSKNVVNGKEYIYIKSDKFVKKYQGRTYITVKDYDQSNHIIHFSDIREYISVGYQTFVTNPQLLYEKDKMLYDYFKKVGLVHEKK